MLLSANSCVLQVFWLRDMLLSYSANHAHSLGLTFHLVVHNLLHVVCVIFQISRHFRSGRCHLKLRLCEHVDIVSPLQPALQVYPTTRHTWASCLGVCFLLLDRVRHLFVCQSYYELWHVASSVDLIPWWHVSFDPRQGDSLS